MSKALELADKAGFWREHTNTWMAGTVDIEKFYALARSDLEDDAGRLRKCLGEWQDKHAGVCLENAALAKDAARYRWLREHVTETPMDMQRFTSEFPDTRLIWKLPTLVSTTCINSSISFDDAVDNKMEVANEQGT